MAGDGGRWLPAYACWTSRTCRSPDGLKEQSEGMLHRETPANLVAVVGEIRFQRMSDAALSVLSVPSLLFFSIPVLHLPAVTIPSLPLPIVISLVANHPFSWRLPHNHRDSSEYAV